MYVRIFVFGFIVIGINPCTRVECRKFSNNILKKYSPSHPQFTPCNCFDLQRLSLNDSLWGLFIYDFTSQLIFLASYFSQLVDFSSQLILLASYFAHLKIASQKNQLVKLTIEITQSFILRVLHSPRGSVVIITLY